MRYLTVAETSENGTAFVFTVTNGKDGTVLNLGQITRLDDWLSPIGQDTPVQGKAGATLPLWP
ncbi:MAG TPA: hypothetical protein GX735_01030 [Firmicutes bacterium]|nr:hypothetical protein [Bacillota bacterium]